MRRRFDEDGTERTGRFSGMIPSFNLSRKGKVSLGVILALGIATPMMVGINSAGERTVIQYPWGGLSVKFAPGPYMHLFGSTEEYPDVMTYDFNPAAAAGDTVSIDTAGIPVRYQDGGTGSIFGVSRYNLPNDEAMMVALHKAFRSKEGLAFKLIKPVTEETMNLTAGLLTSEGAYAEQRGTFIEWSLDQLKNGKYRTVLKGATVKDEAGEQVYKNIPVIAYQEDNISPQRLGESDLMSYGISISGYQVTDWGFEGETLDQISKKREATMAIITAKANADRAKQDAITAKEEGLKNVAVAKYAKEVEKQQAVTDAEKDKEVAILAAKQQVEVAQQKKLEAVEKKLAASEYKEEQILIGEGESARKRLVMEADGALGTKVDAWVRVNGFYADAMAKQKWVPEIMMGGTGTEGQSNMAQNLIDMFAVKTAKDLNLDMSIVTPTQAAQQTFQDLPNSQMNQATQ